MFIIVNKLQATKLYIQQLSGLNIYNERFFSVFIMQVLKIESSCSIRSKIAFFIRDTDVPDNLDCWFSADAHLKLSS